MYINTPVTPDWRPYCVLNCRTPMVAVKTPMIFLKFIPKNPYFGHPSHRGPMLRVSIACALRPHGDPAALLAFLPRPYHVLGVSTTTLLRPSRFYCVCTATPRRPRWNYMKRHCFSENFICVDTFIRLCESDAEENYQYERPWARTW